MDVEFAGASGMLILGLGGISMDMQESRSGSGILRTVGAVTALLTAVAGLIGALAAAGVFDRQSGPDPTVITEPVDPPTTPVPTTAPPSSTTRTEDTVLVPDDRRTAVTLAYLGDAEGCGLGISIAVGDRIYVPVGNSYAATDVSIGSQSYGISGMISCPFSGQCQASGSGLIDVAAGRTYFVQWQNTAVGFCDVVLAS